MVLSCREYKYEANKTSFVFLPFFYNFLRILQALKVCADRRSEVLTPIGSFEFLPTKGTRPNRNKCVGSSDRVLEVPITIGNVRFLPTKGAQPARFNRIGSSDNYFFYQELKSLLWENKPTKIETLLYPN